LAAVQAQEHRYIPLNVQPLLKAQAVRVWLVGCAITFFWVLLILTPPIAKANGYIGISSPLYSFFSLMCHQMPDRSYHIDGEKFGVCSRCFGVYFGLLFGFLVYPLWRRIDETEPISRVWLFASLVPIGIDWSLGVFGIWANTFTSRTITGLILGFACAIFLVPAAVEIMRNLTLSSKIKKAA
jgi:uncharacterized membrane protein